MSGGDDAGGDEHDDDRSQGHAVEEETGELVEETNFNSQAIVA